MQRKVKITLIELQDFLVAKAMQHSFFLFFLNLMFVLENLGE